MTTGKLSCLGSRLRSLRELRRASFFKLAHRSAEGAKVGRPRQSCQRSIPPLRDARRRARQL